MRGWSEAWGEKDSAEDSNPSGGHPSLSHPSAPSAPSPTPSLPVTPILASLHQQVNRQLLRIRLQIRLAPSPDPVNHWLAPPLCGLSFPLSLTSQAAEKINIQEHKWE